VSAVSVGTAVALEVTPVAAVILLSHPQEVTKTSKFIAGFVTPGPRYNRLFRHMDQPWQAQYKHTRNSVSNQDNSICV